MTFPESIPETTQILLIVGGIIALGAAGFLWMWYEIGRMWGER